ncbi:Uncharacterised protein [Neisseria gonorrhoeae]|uniref:Uncharacterized protein n=1 Tax=Neisseria gonorrhoeae TaxID=485 RepID=A0A378VXF0_NEIGO|nr:Uncharacterised protein [Neisseria gonorrhoeae]
MSSIPFSDAVSAMRANLKRCRVWRFLFLRAPKRFLQRGDLRQPRPVDLFGDKVRFSLRAAFGGDFARIRLIGGFEQGEPVRALRVGRVFAFQTALRVGNADVQCRLKTLGTAEGIGFFNTFRMVWL